MKADTKRGATRRRSTAAAALASFAISLCVAPSAMAFDNPILGLWPLDEGSGQTVSDFSGARNHGILGATAAADSGDPAWIALPSTRWYKRSALHFAGDDFVTVADSPTLEPKNISVGAVVRATGSPGSYRYVASKGTLQCTTASYGLYTGRNGGMSFYVSNGIEYSVSADAGTQLWDGAWHVVLGTFDGGRVRLFVDGKEVGTPTPTSLSLTYGFPDNDGFYVGDYGGRCGNPLGFVGDIDAVAVANRAITWSGS